MATPFIGECKLVGFNFAPIDWLMCQGQLLPISNYEALYSLIGTTYGGDGQTNFQLPDLQGRTPLHQGSNSGQTFSMGQRAGTEQVTITQQTTPTHNHPLIASSANGNSNFPATNLLATNPTFIYVTTGPPIPTDPLNANAISSIGGNLPHNNLQPYLAMTWVISLYGIYPSAS